jgi:hypothetical protein
MMSMTTGDRQNLTESKVEQTARELAPAETEAVAGGGTPTRPVPTTLPLPPCC